MSATSVSNSGGNESAYLGKLRFTVIDSGISSSINPEDCLPEKTLEDFLDRKTRRARLIYCREEDEADFMKAAADRQLHVRLNLREIKELRELTLFDCLVVS